VMQDESRASYEGWCREAEARINWHGHIDQIYNLIRGCDPAPGAWTSFKGKKLQLFDCRKHSARTFSEVKGKIGAITAITEKSINISAQGGQIEAFRVRYDGGKKLPAPQFCAEAGLSLNTILGA
jgi:methionyl-tRNA formyltransferase